MDFPSSSFFLVYYLISSPSPLLAQPIFSLRHPVFALIFFLSRIKKNPALRSPLLIWFLVILSVCEEERAGPDKQFLFPVFFHFLPTRPSPGQNFSFLWPRRRRGRRRRGRRRRHFLVIAALLCFWPPMSPPLPRFSLSFLGLESSLFRVGWGQRAVHIWPEWPDNNSQFHEKTLKKTCRIKHEIYIIFFLF